MPRIKIAARGEAILAVILAVGLLALFWYQYLKVTYDYTNQVLFWCAFCLSVGALASASLRKGWKNFFMGFAVFLVIIAFMGLFPGSSQTYLGYDDAFESNLVDTTLRLGRLDPHEGLGFARDYYGYFPALHLFMASWSLMAGFSPLVLGRFMVPVVLNVSYIVVFYVIAKTLVGHDRVRPALLLAASSLTMISNGTSRWPFAGLFLLMLAYFAGRIGTRSGNLRNDFILFCICLTLVTLGHHLTLVVGILLMLSLWLASYALEKRMKLDIAARRLRGLFLVVLVPALAYYSFYTVTVLRMDIQYKYLPVWEAIRRLSFARLTSVLEASGGAYGIPALQKYLAYGSIVAFLLATLMCWIYVLRRKNVLRDANVYWVAVWSTAQAAVLVPLVPSLLSPVNYWLIMATFIAPSFLPFSLLVAFIAVSRLHASRLSVKKIAFIIFVVVLFVGGLTIRYPTYRYVAKHGSAPIVNDEVYFASVYLNLSSTIQRDANDPEVGSSYSVFAVLIVQTGSNVDRYAFTESQTGLINIALVRKIHRYLVLDGRAIDGMTQVEQAAGLTALARIFSSGDISTYRVAQIP